MTPSEVRPSPGTGGAAAHRTVRRGSTAPRLARLVRLARLHLASRQAPVALAVIAGCGLLLRLLLRTQVIEGSGNLAQQVPLLLEGTVAVAVSVATRNPFGESERGTGGRLPWLRLFAVLATSAAAVGGPTAGALGARLPGGDWAVLRNVSGLTGIGLLCAVLLGGALAWAGPLAGTAIGEFALTGSWHSPWMFPARPPHDLGAALCAGLLFAAGAALVTIRGPRDTDRE